MKLPDEITGLAWSGHGRLGGVEVLTDAGETWVQARLDGPVLPCCLTRFRLPWRWRGEPAVLRSRTIDEHSHQPPARVHLLREHGGTGYFYHHAIVSWAIASDGEVSHIYVDAQLRKPSLDCLFIDEK